MSPETAGPGLAPSPAPAEDPRLEAAERRRRAALGGIDALDGEVERLSEELGEFSRRYHAEMAGPFAELAEAERLVRRLQELEDELGRLKRILSGAEPVRPRSLRRARPGPAPAREPAPGPGDGETSPDGDEEEGNLEVEVLPDEAELKRLHRRLARRLHPDLATDDAERERLSALMARVNDAYTRRDRSALELIAERLFAGEVDAEISLEERIAHARRRAEALEGIAAVLGRERDRLLASATRKLFEEAARRARAGGDFLADMRREVGAEAAEARADGLKRLERVSESAADLGRRWRSAMTGLAVRGGGKGLRPFDPVAESPLVRRGVLELERSRAGAAARDLARGLEAAAEGAPWEAAAVLLAFFAEAARRPPESLATPEGWRERWEALREAWPEAPEFERLLGRLPRHGLGLGLRAFAGEVAAGLQLTSEELFPGVHIALAREPVAAVARRVLAALGPSLRCPRCRRERAALHLLRTRGLDEVHGLVCPKCGSVLRSYWRYGEAEGLEALAPLALELGVVSEQVARLGPVSLAFQMLPFEREALSASRLSALFAETHLTPCHLDLGPARIRVRVGKRWLSASARLPQRGVTLDTWPAGAAPGARELVETLRTRIAKRFRPGAAEDRVGEPEE